ncbi:hypothetical protein D7B24_000241 [Verticillium nonalfalfae]|uniref:Fungal N-terminal domain-containing protein n=1 Tax=Verticillium nonalfalfae TaxID=1051616 RepID=A0A3M9YJR9_9PEZI|nr:uncharacterized protein D7B24_000241 [Verticillium nonalfalfae]RNJ60046.1 hypothetical protein D7B24_000241 [Verticillium nonalfalfae]
MVLDAIGIGLGAATFAADLTLAIVKLKQLWDEVKDTPDEIASILENLQVIDLIIGYGAAKIKWFQEALASIKIVLQKSTFQHLEKKLQRALQTLDLAIRNFEL